MGLEDSSNKVKKNVQETNVALNATELAYKKGFDAAVQLTAESRSLTEELKDQLGIRSKQNEGDKTLLQISRDITKSSQANKVALGQQDEITAQIKKETKQLGDATREQSILAKTLTKDEIENAKAIASAVENQFAQQSKIEEIKDKIATATGDELKDLLQQKDLQEGILNNIDEEVAKQLEGATAGSQRLALANQLATKAAKNLELSEEEKEKQDKITDSMGIMGSALKGINEIAGDFGKALGLDEVNKKMKAFTEEAIRNNKSVSRLQTLGVGIKASFGQLGKTLTDPTVIIAALVKGFKEVDKANVDFMRQTGQDLNELTTSVDSANMRYITMADYIKTASELTKELGQNAAAIFGPEDIIEAAEMTEAMGMASNEATNLARLSKINGGNIKDQNKAIVAGVNAANKQNKTAVAAGNILKKVANTSAGIAISYAGYPKELGKAAAAAEALGMSLDDIDKISGSLLNFQQSIEDEMAAELLTGKQLNLEKARQLALNNDLAGVAEELSKQGLNSTEFSKMNRIQQEAQAKALGMSRDQMAKMLLQQELSGSLKKDDLNAAQKQTLEQLKQEEASVKMKKAMEKLAQAFAPIVGAIANIVSNTWVLYGLMAYSLFAKMRPLVKMSRKLAGGFKDAWTNAKNLSKGLMDLVKRQGGGKLKKALGLGGGDITKDAKGRFRDAKGRFAKNPMAKTMDKGAEATGKMKKKTKGAGDKGPGGFLKSLGDGLASIGKKFANVVKGALALGIAGIAIGGSFALALKMVEGVDPKTMLAFATSIGIFGGALALVGKQASNAIKGAIAMGIVGVALIPAAFAFKMMAGVSTEQIIGLSGAMIVLGGAAAILGALASNIITGALALGILGLALVPAAFAFSLLEGVDTNTLIAFSIALPLLALASAGLGFIAPFIMAGALALGVLGLALIPAALGFSMIQGLDMESIISFASGIGILATTAALMGLGAPLILLGSVALAALGLAMVPLSIGFERMAGANTEGLVTSIAQFAALAPGLTATAAALFAVAGGLGAMALAGIAALPVMAGLAGLGTVATGIAGVLGLGDEGGEGEAAPASNDTTILAQKLDQMNATLNAILAKEGTVTLDGTKVGTALTVANSKLQ